MPFVLKRGLTVVELLVIIAVISILATSVVLLLNPTKRIKQTRDAQRRSDIRALADSLIAFHVSFGYFPIGKECDSSIGEDTAVKCEDLVPKKEWALTGEISKALTGEGYFKNLPIDPINNQNFYYAYVPQNDPAVCGTGGPCSFWIGARLEAPDSDINQFFRCSTNQSGGLICGEVEESNGAFSVSLGDFEGAVELDSLSEPIRAAFYYPWYPEQWSGAGHRWTSSLGLYDSSDSDTIKKHIEWLKLAKVDAGLYSWWGKGHNSDNRLDVYLDKAEELNFKWGIYYELDYSATRSEEDIKEDIAYLKDNYFNKKGYLRVNNKPVVFVYVPTGGSCNTASKWKNIKDEFGIFVSMTDVPEWWTCNVLDSWHGYKPDSYVKSVYVDTTVYSISVSAGFWAAWESSPRLERNFVEWQNAVSAMSTYKPKWQLVYFNEFGEGTNIEPSDARCNDPGCEDYLNVLKTAPK